MAPEEYDGSLSLTVMISNNGRCVKKRISNTTQNALNHNFDTPPVIMLIIKLLLYIIMGELIESKIINR